MAKRPAEDIAQSRVKQRVGLQDYGGQQEWDVGIDTLPPPRTDVQLGQSSSTSQVASHIFDFEVAESPASNMVVGQCNPHELSSSDREVLECISWGDREEGRVDILPVILRRIARQAGHEISIQEAMTRINDPWLQKTLTTGWERGSFNDIRCLGECHLFLPHEQPRVTCFQPRFYAKHIARSRPTHRCGNGHTVHPGTPGH